MTELIHEPVQSRYELHGDEGELLGFIAYLPAGESTIIAHTEVAVEHEGEGVGGRLVRAVFEAVAADGRTVIPLCPFAAAYVRRHPELAAQVAPSMRAQFKGAA
jgi:predicted GNAT family acetyltransferase